MLCSRCLLGCFTPRLAMYVGPRRRESFELGNTPKNSLLRKPMSRMVDSDSATSLAKRPMRAVLWGCFLMLALLSSGMKGA